MDVQKQSHFWTTALLCLLKNKYVFLICNNLFCKCKKASINWREKLIELSYVHKQFYEYDKIK